MAQLTLPFAPVWLIRRVFMQSGLCLSFRKHSNLRHNWGELHVLHHAWRTVTCLELLKHEPSISTARPDTETYEQSWQICHKLILSSLASKVL